jgi:hypothetical protein
MTITETKEFFKILIKESQSKREIRVFRNFIGTLSSLKAIGLTNEQLLLIEDEIEVLNLETYPTNKRRFFSKKLSIFQEFLKAEFSLISKNYYTSLGMVLGMCFGVALGTSFGFTGTSSGLVIGMLFGLAIGYFKDKEAEKNNKVLINSASMI